MVSKWADYDSSSGKFFGPNSKMRFLILLILTGSLDEDVDHSVEAGYIRRLRLEIGHLSFYDQVRSYRISKVSFYKI